MDTVNLFTYAVLRLTPLALSSGVSTWSSSGRGNTACNTSAGAVLANSGPVVSQYHNSHDTYPLRDHNYPIVRPLQHSKWSKGKDGFLITDIWAPEVNNLVPPIPAIWLHQTEEKVYLLAYQHRGLTVIILIPVSSVNEQEIVMVKQQIIENVRFYFIQRIGFLHEVHFVVVACLSRAVQTYIVNHCISGFGALGFVG